MNIHQGTAQCISVFLQLSVLVDWQEEKYEAGGHQSPVRAGFIDLLIPSSDKRCENNDAWNAWAGMAQILKGRKSTARGWVQDLAGSWKVNLWTLLLTPGCHYYWMLLASAETLYSLSMRASASWPVICKALLTAQAFINKWKGNLNWWPLQPHKCNFPEEYLKIKNEKISIFT